VLSLCLVVSSVAVEIGGDTLDINIGIGDGSSAGDPGLPGGSGGSFLRWYLSNTDTAGITGAQPLVIRANREDTGGEIMFITPVRTAVAAPNTSRSSLHGDRAPASRVCVAHGTVRRAIVRGSLAVLAVAGILSAAPPPAARAGSEADPVLLRYAFTAAERFAYDGFGSERLAVAAPGQPPQLSGFDVHYIVSYRIRSVEQDGTAVADTRMLSPVFATIGAGSVQVSRQAPPPEVDRMGPDNSLPGQTPAAITLNSVYTAHLSYGVALLGPFPATAVAPSARWRDTVDLELAALVGPGLPAGLPPAHVASATVFAGLRQEGATPVAVLRSVGSIAYAGSGRGGVRVAATGEIALTSTIDLQRHRLRSSVGYYSLTLEVGQSPKRKHLLLTYTLSPRGA
jgi:hypothetical protein